MADSTDRCFRKKMPEMLIDLVPIALDFPFHLLFCSSGDPVIISDQLPKFMQIGRASLTQEEHNR